jgi:sugar phosphate isomerase/epimerase
MVAKRQFGISTRLYASQRLTRDHLLEIAAHGFEVIEVAALPGHFDPSNDAAVADLQQWLAEARLVLDAVAAPPPDGPQPWSAGALQPVEAALYVARRIPIRVLVVAVGSAKSAAKAMDRLVPLADPLGVAVAVDSRSTSMSPIGSLVAFVERCEVQVGIALDLATAGKGTTLPDAIELASEHLTCVRLPAESSINWSSVMTTVQKVGYESPFIIEPAGPAALKTAQKARERLERLFAA